MWGDLIGNSSGNKESKSDMDNYEDCVGLQLQESSISSDLSLCQKWSSASHNDSSDPPAIFQKNVFLFQKFGLLYTI